MEILIKENEELRKRNALLISEFILVKECLLEEQDRNFENYVKVKEMEGVYGKCALKKVLDHLRWFSC